MPHRKKTLITITDLTRALWGSQLAWAGLTVELSETRLPRAVLPLVAVRWAASREFASLLMGGEGAGGLLLPIPFTAFLSETRYFKDMSRYYFLNKEMS